MKKLLYLILFIICPLLAVSQKKFTAIDAHAKSIGYLPLQELTMKLTAPYPDEEDKVRSVFMWIAYHITYDDAEAENSDTLRYDRYKYGDIKPQSLYDSLWNIEYANFVLKHHKAICGEYAALFKAMCDIASLKCEIIFGYAKWYSWIGLPYKENHAWNAVFLNGKWQLLDVTWAVDEPVRKGNRLIKNINTFYYCTPPELLINNHYPDKIKWTLLDKPTSRTEFEKAIYFNYEGRSKIKVENVIPKIGFLRKRVGDSVSFEISTSVKVDLMELSLNDTVEAISYFPFPDTVDTVANAHKQVQLRPVAIKPASLKEAKAIDAILNDVDTASELSLQNETKPLVVSGNQSPKIEAVDMQYFKQNGNKTSFKYYIKKKGDYLIWVSINYEYMMAFRLLVE